MTYETFNELLKAVIMGVFMISSMLSLIIAAERLAYITIRKKSLDTFELWKNFLSAILNAILFCEVANMALEEPYSQVVVVAAAWILFSVLTFLLQICQISNKKKAEKRRAKREAERERKREYSKAEAYVEDELEELEEFNEYTAENPEDYAETE